MNDLSKSLRHFHELRTHNLNANERAIFLELKTMHNYAPICTILLSNGEDDLLSIFKTFS